MKSLVFGLFVLITDSQGNEKIDLISKHKTLLSCHAEKAHHGDNTENVKFYCLNVDKFIKK